MPDTYVKLPNGQYVQIPEGASPAQLGQLQAKLIQMQAQSKEQAPFDAALQDRQQLDDGEQVTLILPTGEKQKFLIPSGMSDSQAKIYILSKRPDLFRQPAPTFASAAAQAHQQSIKQASALMDASGYPELAKAKPSGNLPSRSRAGLPSGEPDVEATLNALPALGGTVGAAFGGVPGAALGGAAGESAKGLIKTAATGKPTQNPVTDIATQGAVQGLLEGGGQVLNAAGKMIAPTVVKRFAGTALSAHLDNLGQAIDSYLSQSGLAKKTVDIAKPINQLMEDEIAKASRAGADSLADRLTELESTWNKNYNLKNPTLRQANEFRREIADFTTFAGEANKETINKIQRQVVGVVGNEIKSVAPGIQPLNDAYANAVATQEAMKQSAKKLTKGFTGTTLGAASGALKAAGKYGPTAARIGQNLTPSDVDSLLEEIRNRANP